MSELSNGVNPEDQVITEREFLNPITGEVTIANDLDALVGQWNATKDLIRQIYQFKDELERVIVDFAGEGPTNTTYLETQNGTIKVTRKNIIKYNNEKLEEAVFLLGDEEAGRVGIKRTLKPNLTTLRKFLSTRQTDKTTERARELIRESMTEQPAKPLVTLSTK
tara:strand:- start:10791 stop:11285 length:495 start_codon:yes stop_codon:yes gene_type:complete